MVNSLLETLIYIVVGVFTVGFPVWYIVRERRSSAEAAAILRKAVERGLDEPVSLHPIVDPNTCIATGACVKACPEVKVIGLIGGKAALINPARCIGHGLCAAACPVEAITLVFGTEKRGVDIPHVNGDFETNVSGVYIAGELGGMGLIRNAVTQGRQAVQNIARGLVGRATPPMLDSFVKTTSPTPPSIEGGEWVGSSSIERGERVGASSMAGGNKTTGAILDLIIVGAGPAGIGASLQATKERLNFLTIDQEGLGGTILTYPRRKLVMTQPMEFPIHGVVPLREVSKEALLELFVKIFTTTGLVVRGSEKVDDVRRENGHFKVVTNKGEYRSRKVLLAIGRRGSPRKLGVPGEYSTKVAYRLLDPEKFHDLNILVVGGGDSAVEAAVALSEQPGNVVHVSYRRENFFRIKEGNQVRVDAAIGQGKVTTLFNSEVKEIFSDRVALDRQGENIDLPNDQIFIFAGGELPTEFLKKVGIEFTRKHGEH